MRNTKHNLTTAQMAGLRHQINWKLQRIHVGTSNRSVVRMLYPNMVRLEIKPRQRKALYRYAIREHQRNRDLYSWVMGGLK